MSKLSVSRFHFIGIGGIGMCGLAELLHNMGAHVTGSDLVEGAQVRRLRGLGIEIHLGHKPSNVGAPDVVVYSSAVQLNNPEIIEARSRKIPVIRRAEALAEIMRLKRGIAIGGTHGKTTTTSLVSNVLLGAGLKPTIVVGGRLDTIKSTAQLGQGEWMVAEADESDGSFSLLSPEICVVTNIDTDHLDHYESLENLRRAFFDFALRVPFYGAVVACGDDEITREVFSDFPKRVVFYGFSENLDYFLRGDNGSYGVYSRGGQKVSEFQISMPGKHNALNALAAYIVGVEVGLDPDLIVQGLKSFTGVDRRFQWIGREGGVDFYDDYAHHPTEIRAALQGFREKFPARKLKVLFQPHRYSRTELCWQEFLHAFDQADEVYLTDIYPAGEAPRSGITSERMCKELVGVLGHYVGADVLSEKTIDSWLQEDDVFVTFGAGSVGQWSHKVCQWRAR